MEHDIASLLAAERRGRTLVWRLRKRLGEAWRATVRDDADGAALLAASRMASRFGTAVTVHPVGPFSSPLCKILARGVERIGLVAEAGPPPRDNATTLSAGGCRIEGKDIPDEARAWTMPLSEAAPLILPPAGLCPRSCAQCREVDRIAMEKYLVPGICLMENAAAAAVTVAMDMLSRHAGTVLIVAGGGNNGGDGLAMARGLAAAGADVEVALFKAPERLSGDAAANYRLLSGLHHIPLYPAYDGGVRLAALAEGKGLIVDALLGTGFTGVLSAPFLNAVQTLNASDGPILSLDLPSGLDGDSGRVAQEAIRATRTITFAALKTGLLRDRGAEHSGEIVVADIGAPAGAYGEERCFPNFQ